MTTKLTIPYAKIEREVSAIIARGAENLKAAYVRQGLVTNWEVGHYLKETLPLDEVRSANNARIIGRLEKKFDRSDTYFYKLIRFAKVYPKLPKNSSLSWSHYDALLKVKDDCLRKKYERMAVQKNIQAKILYGMIIKDKIERKKMMELPPCGDCSPKEIPLARGRLYHYKVTAPAQKDAQSNTGTATLDVGFTTYRDIPLREKSRLHAGHMVRTLRSETSGETFIAKIATANKDWLYTYKAQVKRVVDGDTIIAMIDLGLKTKTKQRLRLRGIDCSEISEKRGVYAKDYVKKLLDKQKFIIVKTYKDGKYGRMIADIFYLTGETDPHVVVEKGIFLNQHLVDEGLADIWQG